MTYQGTQAWQGGHRQYIEDEGCYPYTEGMTYLAVELRGGHGQGLAEDSDKVHQYQGVGHCTMGSTACGSAHQTQVH